MKSKYLMAFWVGLVLQMFVTQNLAADDILTTAARNGSFSKLVSLVVAADLDEALAGKGNFTVFAPTDEAFSKLPAETLKELLKTENKDKLASILKYHVLGKEISIAKRRPSHPITSATTLNGAKVKFNREGTQVAVNDANIVIRNIKCDNGLIHVIDAVLLPPVEDKTIVGVAAKAGSFDTLLTAAKAAGLAKVLQGKGPFTVFAPTDKAFSKLPKSTLKELLQPENNDKLAAILKYHVIPAKVTAQDAVKAESAKTLLGEKVSVSIRDGRLLINGANVISNDVEAENGIIHVIDEVLLPESKSDKHTSTTSDKLKEIVITANWSRPVKRDGIVADRVKINCTGGGSATLTNVDAREIVTYVSGGGAVRISGNVGKHEARVSGGGVLRARDLRSDETKIRVNGGGDATVNATDLLNATAFSGATIKYVRTNATIKKSINKYATFGPIH